MRNYRVRSGLEVYSETPRTAQPVWWVASGRSQFAEFGGYTNNFYIQGQWKSVESIAHLIK